MNATLIGQRLGNLSDLPSDLLAELRPDSFCLGMECSAVLSDDRRYRYELWRRWATGSYALFIGLNPSTADETMDDPTIRRCIGFAKAWGFSALCMANLFAFRATEPTVMKASPDPIGPENDATLSRLASYAGIIIAAWGAHGSHQDRAASVLERLPAAHHLGLTKAGLPRHPLYLKKDITPVPFR